MKLQPPFGAVFFGLFRHCEARSDAAIHPAVVLRYRKMDCFTSFAMTRTANLDIIGIYSYNSHMIFDVARNRHTPRHTSGLPLQPRKAKKHDKRTNGFGAFAKKFTERTEQKLKCAMSGGKKC